MTLENIKVFFISLFLLSCNERQEVVDEMTRLKTEMERTSVALPALQTQVAQLMSARDALQNQITALRSDEDVLKAEKDGKGIHYIFSVSIRQVSYSLSLSKQLRDAVNEETFDMPVDRVTYEHTSVGQDLFDSFRAGSALFHGSLGSWRLKVENKRIVIDR